MVTPDKKIESNSAEVVRSFIATWNTHDTSAILDLLDPDIVFRSPLFSSPVRGLEARRGEIENFLTSMPDFQFKLIGIAAEGDFVATEYDPATQSGLVALIPVRRGRIAVNRRRFLGSVWNCRAPEAELLGRIKRPVDAGHLKDVNMITEWQQNLIRI